MNLQILNMLYYTEPFTSYWPNWKDEGDGLKTMQVTDEVLFKAIRQKPDEDCWNVQVLYEGELLPFGLTGFPLGYVTKTELMDKLYEVVKYYMFDKRCYSRRHE